MQGSRALSGVILLLVLVMFLVNTKPAWALTITPSAPTAGIPFTISGNSASSTATLSVYEGSSCRGLLVVSTSESGSGPYIFTEHVSQAGAYSAIVTGDPAGCVDFSVTASVDGPVTAAPYSTCVISLGVEQLDGSVLWLPGYTYPGTPISQCQDKTEVLGQDVQGRTIVMRQFVLYGTSTG